MYKEPPVRAYECEESLWAVTRESSQRGGFLRRQEARWGRGRKQALQSSRRGGGSRGTESECGCFLEAWLQQQSVTGDLRWGEGLVLRRTNHSVRLGRKQCG